MGVCPERMAMPNDPTGRPLMLEYVSCRQSREEWRWKREDDDHTLACLSMFAVTLWKRTSKSLPQTA
jgi:hypothetical protein